MAGNKPDFGALLSPELWRVVIGFIQPDASAEQTTWGTDLARSQSTYFCTKTTNKKNLEVCASYPELSCSLILSEYSDKSRLVSLLGWLSGRRHIIQSMAAYCDKAILDIVLGALVCPMSQSTSVVLLHFSPSTVMLLRHLPLLSRCVLTQTNSPADLSPLRMCLKLQILILFTGEFIMQELSQHLTSLLLHNAGLHLKQECPCVMSLIKLELE